MPGFQARIFEFVNFENKFEVRTFHLFLSFLSSPSLISSLARPLNSLFIAQLLEPADLVTLITCQASRLWEVLRWSGLWLSAWRIGKGVGGGGGWGGGGVVQALEKFWNLKWKIPGLQISLDFYISNNVEKSSHFFLMFPKSGGVGVFINAWFKFKSMK